MRHYLGGASDLRGFNRQELPLGEEGGLRAVAGSLEIRHVSTYLEALQPFIFIDVGRLGVSPAAFDKPVYYSPGIGFRLDLPFGVFRATYAWGFVKHVRSNEEKDKLSHPQTYFSFGEEF